MLQRLDAMEAELADMKKAGLLAKYAAFDWPFIGQDVWLETLYEDAKAQAPAPGAPSSSSPATTPAPGKAKQAPRADRPR